MATDFPPDGFDVYGTGVSWPTDIDFTVSSAALTGDGYWNWLATNPAGNPGLIWDTPIPIEGGSPIAVYAPLYASSINALDKMRVGIKWLDESEATISTVYAFDSALGSTGTWENHGGVLNAPANARFAQPVCEAEKGATSFTARMDRLDIWEMPIMFSAALSVAQSVFGSYNVIEFDTVDGSDSLGMSYEYGSNFDTGNFWYLTPVPGTYSFVGGAYLLAPNAGENLTMAIYLDSQRIVQGRQILLTTDSAESTSVVTSGPLFVEAGVKVTIRMSSSVSENIGIAGNSTFFRGAKVE